MDLRSARFLVGLASSVALVGCGGSTGDGRDDASSGINSLGDTGDGSVDTDSADTDSADTGSADNGSADTGDGDGDTDTADSSDGGGPKFDLAPVPDAAIGECGGGGGMGDPEWSNIWISNSPQGTVSKIDTMTAVETARYSAGPGSPDPSRTSVNLLGDAAVVDRNGGIMKVAAQLEDCVDSNNNGMIETSTGPGNILPWGTDECVLWHVPLPASGNRGPRPVAWEGKYNEQDCVYESPRVWVGHYHQSNNVGVFYRLDGETGEILDQLEHPWSGNNWGPYGGAVNGEGDFFVLGWSSGPLIRIDGETLAVTQWQTPGGYFVYGMTVDQNGDVWACGSSNYHHFDIETETWTTVSGGTSMRGAAAHPDGYMWFANPGGVVKADMETKQLIQQLQLPGVSSPVGVSVDPEGFVWLVDQSGSKAVKVDPETHQIVGETLGLVSPYTYSDMTGGGLNLVAGGPQG